MSDSFRTHTQYTPFYYARCSMKINYLSLSSDAFVRLDANPAYIGLRKLGHYGRGQVQFVLFGNCTLQPETYAISKRE